MRPGEDWSRTVDYGPGPLHAPASLDELQDLVRRSSRIRALGSRHSFSAVAASEADLVSLSRMPPEITVDPVSATAWVSAATSYGQLARTVEEQGFALSAMGSLPHISVAGAVATGTHGSGDDRRSLAAAVRAVELVRADGEHVRISREADPAIVPGAVIALGALGITTRLQLELVPRHSLRQCVYRDLPPDRFTQEGLEQVFAGGSSVSVFHRWDGRADQIWVKQRAGGGDPPPPELFCGARRVQEPIHPVPELPATACTDQSGTPGPPSTRLPHFRPDFPPSSSGDEIQSEYMIAREDLAAALEAVMPLAQRIRPLLQVSEIRTLAADDLWLSPAVRRDSACLHFTWLRRPAAVRALLPEIEAALAPFAPRPHWGKVFTLAPQEVRSRYPRWGDFADLVARMDPGGRFRNAFVDRLLG